MNRAILDSMHAGIAVLDARGRIAEVNAGWRRLRAESVLAELVDAAPGDEYLETCRRAADAGCEGARRCLEGLRAVLAGELAQFDLEYESPAHEPRRRYHVRAVALPRPPGGLVVAHLEAADSGSARMSAAHGDEP
jgi:PAS domain-containing protein